MANEAECGNLMSWQFEEECFRANSDLLFLFFLPFQIVLCQRAMAASGASPEDFAKMMIIQTQLIRRGAQPKHVAETLMKVIGKVMV